MCEKEKICAIALNAVFGYEPAVAKAMVENLGSAEAVFALGRDGIDDLLAAMPKYRGMLGPERLDAAEKEYSALARDGCDFVPFCSADYPALLKECPDAPAGLYVRSSSPVSDLFNSATSLSIVGTRDMSLYGKEWCERIVYSLGKVPKKAVIVSGLAIGIDVTAHLAALSCSLPTIAVLPCGIDSVYPKRHYVVARKIADSPRSALITDYPPGTTPLPHTFLRRNRIIAGISRATLLVESKRYGGGTVTARFCNDYGRELYALPGRVDDLRSQGCNRLIAAQSAYALADPESLACELGLGKAAGRRSAADSAEEALARYGPGRLAELTAAIAKERGIRMEELCGRLSLPYREVSPLCARLESDGVIETDLFGRCSIAVKNH